MATLYSKVNQYLKANSKTWEAEENNIRLQNDSDGRGDYIHTWNVSGLAEPTLEQLETYDVSATTEENNKQAISNRQKEYGNNTTQIENIIENGLEAEQARVQAIKDKYPKE